jgi:hypothetical protein
MSSEIIGELVPIVAIVFAVGGPMALGALAIPAIRTAVARRIGGHTAEDEELLTALKLRVDALESEVDALNRALYPHRPPTALPPPPPANSLAR